MSEEISLKEFLTDKMDDLGNSINKSINDVNATLKDHNGRLRTNEEWRNRMIGALIIISIVVSGLLFPAIISVLRGKVANADTKLTSEELQQIVTQLKTQ